jgi:hypothetical protein
MWGVPTSLKGFFPGDDIQDPDVYALVGLAVGPLSATGVGTDLLWNGLGTTGPITPTNYVAKIVSLSIASKAASGQEVTLYVTNTVLASSSIYPVGVFALGVQGGLQVSTENFRLNAPPNTKFQAAASISADVVALARYIKGAGQ